MRCITLGLLFLLSACSYAGPFITNISKNSDGSFNIEKCMIEHNPWGYISTPNCTTSTIK